MNIKNKLRNCDKVIGVWCSTDSSNIINIIARSGMDFCLLDMEHGKTTVSNLEDLVRATQIAGSSAVVRVDSLNEVSILKALDSGADGVLIPHVSNSESMRKVVQYTKYFPEGKRGFSSFTAAGGYSLENVKSHTQVQNNSVAVGIIIEDIEGINNLNEILSVGQLDFIYIGAYDLAQSMGYVGDPRHPEVFKVLQSAIDLVKSHNISVGGYAAKSSEDFALMLSMGMNFVTYIPDVTVIYHVFNNICNEFKASLR